MTARAFWALVGTLTLSAVQLASAQEPATRHGFWGAFGLGYGSNSLSCSGGCTFNSGSRGGGPTASIKLGGTPKPSVRLGGEVNVWVKDVGSGSSVSADGIGLLAGLGYDIRLSNKVSLSPIANVYFGRDGDLKDGSTVVIPGIKHTIVDFGLSLQYN